MATTITYRALDANGDPVWGQGQAPFLADLQAVAQAILTRLRLFQGEWWADLGDGLPLWQSILGSSGSSRNLLQVELIINQRILGTPYVIGLSSVSITFNANTRAFTYAATVSTQFGHVAVSSVPVPPVA